MGKSTQAVCSFFISTFWQHSCPIPSNLLSTGLCYVFHWKFSLFSTTGIFVPHGNTEYQKKVQILPRQQGSGCHKFDALPITGASGTVFFSRQVICMAKRGFKRVLIVVINQHSTCDSLGNTIIDQKPRIKKQTVIYQKFQQLCI